MLTGWATVVATLCHISGTPVCVEEVVVESSMQQVSVFECQIHGQLGITEWMREHPIYHTGWRLKSYKCPDGPYTPPNRA